MSQYVMHRNARYFTEPLKFVPERWTAEAREARPQFSYFPFGGGPRRCIGEGFAWMEGILLIATIAQQWQMRLVPNHPVVLKPVITLRPKHGMRMTVTRRHEQKARERKHFPFVI
jgi:cytochrome P450